MIRQKITMTDNLGIFFNNVMYRTEWIDATCFDLRIHCASLFMKTKSDKKRVFVNTIIVSGATIVDKFLFFVINIIVARYLSLADFGEYSTALVYATFFQFL